MAAAAGSARQRFELRCERVAGDEAYALRVTRTRLNKLENLMNSNQKLRTVIKGLFQSVNELEEMFPHRKFTLDGHLVGSIGEVIVAEEYNLELLPQSTKTHDAKSKDRLVQIKLTQVNQVELRSEPEHLIVHKLLPDGTSEKIFNGPGSIVWASGIHQKSGEKSISLTKLKKLMMEVPITSQLKRKQYHL